MGPLRSFAFAHGAALSHDSNFSFEAENTMSTMTAEAARALLAFALRDAEVPSPLRGQWDLPPASRPGKQDPAKICTNVSANHDHSMIGMSN